MSKPSVADASIDRYGLAPREAASLRADLDRALLRGPAAEGVQAARRARREEAVANLAIEGLCLTVEELGFLEMIEGLDLDPVATRTLLDAYSLARARSIESASRRTA